MSAPCLIEEHEAAAPGEEGLSNATLFLALYLILLGFFIALAAHSTISEQRAEAVVAGLGIEREAAKSQTLVARELEARLSEILRQGMAQSDWRLLTSEGEITLTIPERRIFSAESSIIQPGRISVLRRLAAAMAAIDGSRFQVILNGTAGDVLTRRRLAALAQDIQRFGIAPHRYAVAAHPGDGASVRITVQLPGGEGVQ